VLLELLGVLVGVDGVGQVLLDELGLVGLPVRVEEVHDLRLRDLHAPVVPGGRALKQPGHAEAVPTAPVPTDHDADRGADDDADHDADVAVVGAGPAGAAAALAVLAARPLARVVLLDRAEFPRDKSCGDGVAPQVLDVLARLGVRGLLDDWPTVDRLELGYPGGPWLAGRTARPNRVVPRRVLDARLVDAAVARGATLLRRRVRSVTVPEGGSPSVPGEPVVAGVRARVVVGADGAHSAVRASLGPAGGGATAIALRGYAPVTPLLAHAQVIAFDPLGSWPAYAWSFPVGDGSANVGYGEILDAGGAAPTRARLLARLEALLPGAAEGAADWKGHHLPLSTGRWHQPDGRVLLAGDALGLVNPLTGEGIHAAVLSGALAGLAAAAALRTGRPEDAGRRYRSALRDRFGRHQRHMTLLARATRARSGDVAAEGGRREGRGGWIVGAALAAAQHDQRVFDDLTELGLAEGPLTPRIALGLLRQLPRTA